MRAFVVLCLLAVSCADKLAYNYQPVAHSDKGLPFAAGAGAAAATFEAQSNAYLAPTKSATSNVAASYSTISHDVPAELEKEFFSFSAPEGEFDDANAAQRALGAVKQRLRVVFINGPENKGFEDAALALAKQAAQQQTAIYVLNRQADIGDLVNRFNAAGKNANTKPEVHFVKYRTPEDATNAQKAIQSQYDSLSGNSQTINGGIAPVLNFASQAAVPSATVQQPQNVYLPSSVFRFRL